MKLLVLVAAMVSLLALQASAYTLYNTQPYYVAKPISRSSQAQQCQSLAQPMLLLAERACGSPGALSEMPLVVVAQDSLQVVRDGQAQVRVAALNSQIPYATVSGYSQGESQALRAVRVELRQPVYVSSLQSTVPFPDSFIVVHGVDGAAAPLAIRTVLAPVPAGTVLSPAQPFAIKVLYAVPLDPFSTALQPQRQPVFNYFANNYYADAPLYHPQPALAPEYFGFGFEEQQQQLLTPQPQRLPLPQQPQQVPLRPQQIPQQQPQQIPQQQFQQQPQQIPQQFQQQPQQIPQQIPQQFQQQPQQIPQQIPQQFQQQPQQIPQQQQPQQIPQQQFQQQPQQQFQVHFQPRPQYQFQPINSPQHQTFQYQTVHNQAQQSQPQQQRPLQQLQPQQQPQQQPQAVQPGGPNKPGANLVTILEFPSSVASPESLYYQPEDPDSELGNRQPPQAVSPAGIVQSTAPQPNLSVFINSKESSVLQNLRDEAEKEKVNRNRLVLAGLRGLPVRSQEDINPELDSVSVDALRASRSSGADSKDAPAKAAVTSTKTAAAAN